MKKALLCLTLALGGCALPERAPAPLLYDLGPAPQVAVPAAGRPALALRVQAAPLLEGPAMLYRLAYVDATQVHAYARARWAVPPAELIQQRVRQTLGARQMLLAPGEGAARLLRLELETFTQVFETPQRSVGQVRLRATLLQRTPAGERALAQHSVEAQRAALSADAPGGVHALAAATDAALEELMRWLAVQ